MTKEEYIQSEMVQAAMKKHGLTLADMEHIISVEMESEHGMKSQGPSGQRKHMYRLLKHFGYEKFQTDQIIQNILSSQLGKRFLPNSTDTEEAKLHSITFIALCTAAIR